MFPLDLLSWTPFYLIWFPRGHVSPIRAPYGEAGLIEMTQNRDQVLAGHGKQFAEVGGAQSGRTGELSRDSLGRCGKIPRRP